MRVLRTMGILLAMTTIAAGVVAGALDPAEAPAPTQTIIEPRTPVGQETTPGVASASYAITESGSYYLVGNLMGEIDEVGILIAAGDVTLDLMGFQLLGVEGSLSGIRTSGEISGITVRNGTIRDWGRSGVEFQDADECRVQDLTAVSNEFRGLWIGGESCVIEGCIASLNGSTGIVGGDSGVIRNCTSRGNGFEGFFAGGSCVIESCVARGNTDNGFVVNAGGVVVDCEANNNSQAGIMTFANTLVRSCRFSFNRRGGIQGGARDMILDNHLRANGGDGGAAISAGAGARVEGNNVAENFGVGIQTTGEGFVFRNTARNNGASSADNFVLAPGAVAGPIITTANGVAAASPWANFSF